jgi:hypothetical protein
MYYNEHNPPHFHASFAEFHVILLIENPIVLQGHLPENKLLLVLAWAEIHKNELLENWNHAKNLRTLNRIRPLR